MISFGTCATKDKFGNILQQFVELNDAMGVQKEDVGVIIAQVKNTLDAGSSQFTNFFKSIESHCTSASAKLNSALKGLQSNVNDARLNLNNWNKNAAAAVRDQKDAQAQIGVGRTQLAGLNKRIAKITMDYKVFASEADKKLNVIKILRDIITDELVNKTPGALVQVQKFQQKLSELKDLLNNNSDSLYSPMVSVLLDLATEQNFTDQTVLKKILENLNNLNKAMKAFRTRQERALNSEVASIRTQVRNVKGRIRAYRRMRAQAVSKKIDATHYISFYTHEIAHFTAENGRKNAEHTMFKNLCAFERTVHKSGNASFHSLKNTAGLLFSRLSLIHI